MKQVWRVLKVGETSSENLGMAREGDVFRGVRETQEWGKRLLRNWEAKRPGGSDRGQGLRARMGSSLRVRELLERGGEWGL